ncbi:metacaspase type II [Dunaliella salina]|uniref:Metacaspase type II n=1 Tax=Dunaliella salina TaxID=3046 RepID=A0ABQ7GTW1_DUNSA|nr:metacaspase type II [Dunaliella salina]|eukprot:KAF5838042.1 metacaspase type II [Dunaliella salina]
MGRSALLIGCNYPGTKAALQGCVNDVWDFKQTLMECMGFDEDNIAIMVDTDQEYPQPTGKNIRAYLNKMVDEAEDGDLLFLHYSGHGTQLPTDDPEEPDGKNECICPSDLDVISDNDLTKIFAPLSKKNVKLTFVADCCHSGTLLDHKEVIITGPKDNKRPPPQANARSMEALQAALGAGDDSRDIQIRSLPLEVYKELLSGKLGGVDFGDLPVSLIKGFGDESMERWARLFPVIADLQKRGQDTSKTLNTLRESAETLVGLKKAREPLNENVGILLSGCLERECAADVRRKNSVPHGAFSHAVNMLLRQMHKDGIIATNRSVNLGVRESLSKSGLKQSPCLEGSEKWADAAFVLCDEEGSI